MARTKEEIEQSIDNEVALYPELSELQSNSSMVQFWRYCKKVIVFIAYYLEQLFYKHKVEVNEIIETTEAGQITWYLSKILEYQHGDNLTIQNNVPVYSIIDETKRIVKSVAIDEVLESNGCVSLKIKVAKGYNDPLTLQELAGLAAYLQRIKIAGTKIEIVSLPADDLQLEATIILDSILFQSDGTLIADNSEAVKQAIESHLENFAFGSTFYNSKLIDKMMDVPGVIDFHLQSTTLNGTSFDRLVDSPAGHLVLNSNSNLTYVLQ